MSVVKFILTLGGGITAFLFAAWFCQAILDQKRTEWWDKGEDDDD